ncbi:MAG: c-type cytochrome [Hyphomicrobiaceae bacterium]|nr:MAG: c-type cytochrome [Hyphomicrobiaceae bacterium]
MHAKERGSAASVLALAVAALALATTAGADDGILKRGRDIAAARCARCHAIAKDDERPHAIVIPFREMHTRFPIDMLVEARDSGIISGHDEMPMFELSATDMHALLAYIDSLAPHKRGYTR